MRFTDLPFLRYLVILFLVPMVVYPMAFLLVRSASYESWAMSRWGPALDYPFTVRHVDANVVIFGDSSAFLGLDPRIVDAQLGIKSVVLPATIGSLPILSDKPLQAYLAHNRSPQLLVFYFVPWNLDYLQGARIGLYEGEEGLIRHTNPKEIFAFGLHHPAELLKFPFRFFSFFTPQAFITIRDHDRQQNVAEALGHVDYADPHASLASPCTLPAPYLSKTQENSVQALVQRYNQNIPVMVYLAPVPDCNNIGPILYRSFADLHTTPPTVLPADSFAADPYYAHIRPRSVYTASTLFSNALRAALQRKHLSASGPEQTPEAAITTIIHLPH